MKTLDSVKIERAKYRKLFGLDVNCDTIPDMNLYRRNGKLYLAYQNQVIAVGSSIISLEILEEIYENLSGKVVSYQRLRQLKDGVSRDFQKIDWKIEIPRATHSLFDELEAKGIDFYIYE